ncbi:MAG TPA: P1 family peptidase [Stellaceae bacterium]|nr:P1 family peptidase [Stellaceae bacterium]
MALRRGPRNLITDVDGIAVGNAGDAQLRSGVTAIVPMRRMLCAVDVRGGAPGTRETDALDPVTLTEHVDAVVLSGGSAFGLDAAGGVMGWLAGQGRGLRVGSAIVPIVPAAILFDLLNGGEKGWGETSPYGALGRAAASAAGTDFALGNAGAGLGAKAGSLKGGLGSASAVSEDGLQVGALVAVNSRGETTMPGSACFWAWALARDGELGEQRPPAGPLDLPEPEPPAIHVSANTTIGVIATNAGLSKAEAKRVAIMAQDGFARAIRPIHTPYDGDSIFVLAGGGWALPEPRPYSLMRVGAAAADCMARAVMRGVYEAESLGELAAYRDRFQER